MAHGDMSGHAMTSSRRPQGFAVCDACGRWYNLVRLKKLMEYVGQTPQWLGYLVCDECNDKPNPQLKPIRLPGDPKPLVNPRPENFAAAQNFQGFTPYVLYVDPALAGVASKPAVLNNLSSTSGVPTPIFPNDWGGAIASAMVPQIIVPANPARTWLVLYNRAASQLAISLSGAPWGALSNLMLGQGEAFLASGTPPTGAISASGLQPGAQFYAWDF